MASYTVVINFAPLIFTVDNASSYDEAEDMAWDLFNEFTHQELETEMTVTLGTDID